MKLTDQAMGAIMMALQKCLLEQSDITPTLKDFQFSVDENEQLIILNPPSFKVSNEWQSDNQETNKIIGTSGSD